MIPRVQKIKEHLERMGYSVSFNEASGVLSVTLRIGEDFMIKVDTLYDELFEDFAIESIVRRFNNYISERGMGQ